MLPTALLYGLWIGVQIQGPQTQCNPGLCHWTPQVTRGCFKASSQGHRGYQKAQWTSAGYDMALETLLVLLKVSQAGVSMRQSTSISHLFWTNFCSTCSASFFLIFLPFSWSTRFRIFVEEAKPVSESTISSNCEKEHHVCLLANTHFKQRCQSWQQVGETPVMPQARCAL